MDLVYAYDDSFDLVVSHVILFFLTLPTRSNEKLTCFTKRQTFMQVVDFKS